MQDAGTSYDLASATDEARAVGQDAKDAVDAVHLAATAAWAPGKSVLVYLRSAADNLRKAGNLHKLGADNIDPATVLASRTYVEKATCHLTRATTASDALIAKYGPICQ